MSRLSNIAIINQEQLNTFYDFSIKEMQNILVLGPSGAGKTEMGFSSCKNLNMNCIYWNMSVMERPDIQGIPAISADRKTSFFAPQQDMPFIGLKEIKQRRALEDIIAIAREYDEELADFISDAKTQLKILKKSILMDAIQECSSLFDKAKIAKLNLVKPSFDFKSSNNILFLDEIDKTPPENLQPLLELLLYRKINGKQLDIQSVIMTGNLPDEHAYSEPLSHAITNRAMVFELKPDARVWVDWAKNANLYPIIIGFLSREENAAEFFNKRPSNNDMYCYSYTSPRSWTQLSGINYKFDSWLKQQKISESMRTIFNAAIIGQEGASQLEIWVNYFQKYSDIIDRVFNGSNEKPQIEEKTDSDNITARIVVSMAIANKFGLMVKRSTDTPAVQEKAEHVFNWIANNTPKSIKLASFRSCYVSEDFKKHKLQSFGPTRDMFLEIIADNNNTMKIQTDKESESL